METHKERSGVQRVKRITNLEPKKSPIPKNNYKSFNQSKYHYVLTHIRAVH